MLNVDGHFSLSVVVVAHNTPLPQNLFSPFPLSLVAISAARYRRNFLRILVIASTASSRSRSASRVISFALISCACAFSYCPINNNSVSTSLSFCVNSAKVTTSGSCRKSRPGARQKGPCSRATYVECRRKKTRHVHCPRDTASHRKVSFRSF